MTVDPHDSARAMARAGLEYRSHIMGDQEARQELARLDREPAAQATPAASATQPATTEPSAVEVVDEATARRRRTAQMFGLAPEHEVFLTAEDTDELLDQAQRVAGKLGTWQPPTPAFAPNPAQAAGTAAPGVSGHLERGAQLYREHQQRTRNG